MRSIKNGAAAITPDLAALIDADDPADPIARQFAAHPAERDIAPEERDDPIGDAAHSPVAGIVHRYPDRALLLPATRCAAYCRFCFRRDSVGPGGPGLGDGELDTAFAYIEAHPELWEIILSGGDPLVLTDRRLGRIVARLDRIAHVAAIRIHTRMPIARPGRITDRLVAALRVDTPVYVVLHCNHARELGEAARAACRRITDAGLPMLAQTVLLAGVNDDADTLETLMRTLVRNRIKPYYLHHPDLAPGTAHFRVPIARGQALMRELRRRASGLCQPSYVLDIPGGHGKVPVGPVYLTDGDVAGTHIVADPSGGAHCYPPCVALRGAS